MLFLVREVGNIMDENNIKTLAEELEINEEALKQLTNNRGDDEDE